MRPHEPTPPDDPEAREREQFATCLAIMLMAVFGGGFVAFLVFVSLGLFLWVIVMSGVIAAYVGLHYLIWGRPARPNDPQEDENGQSIETNLPHDLLERRKSSQDEAN